MKLFSKIYGEGNNELIIIHGLFGMSDNWNSLGKVFSKDYKTHLIDLRNHGRSPHSEEFNYHVMCEDLLEYIIDQEIQNPIILGHSLGGKVAMKFAFTYPERIKKLIVIDISPREYNSDFAYRILQVLYNLPLEDFSTRNEIENVLASFYSDKGLIFFLLKNLYRNQNKEFAWRFNLNVLLEKVDQIQEASFINGVCEVPSYFLRGENSNYINDNDRELISQHFSNSIVDTIEKAGHWVHVDNTEEFISRILRFLR